jgi:hypothetical protein
LLFGNAHCKIVVEPILAEVLRFSCDVPNEWHINKSRYPSFDFSKVEELGNDWYLSNLTASLQQAIKTKM